MVSQQFACCIYRPKYQSVKKLSRKARVPTKGLERQEVIKKDQSAYQGTRASKETIKKGQSAKLERTTETNDKMETTHG